MLNSSLKDIVVGKLLPQVQCPAQYIGGEWNAVCKDPQKIHGKLCMAFPDAYSIGMSHYGLQVLYDVMNRQEAWACERVFAPQCDMEKLLREHHLPLYSLETFTPLCDFDVLGFTLQYDLCFTNVLTMLDLGGIPLHSEDRTKDHPLVIAGGPCTSNPEPMSRFIDLFSVGDGEEALPEICNVWLELKASGLDREAMLAGIAARLPYVYVPRFYQPGRDAQGRSTVAKRLRDDLPECVTPAVIPDLDAFPPPTKPVVPYVESVQDRITIEIMRGCPGRCRFCQSTALKRPLRARSIDSIIQTAVEQYRTTGYNEISLLSLSSSDYPHFEELMRRMQETFRPLGVAVSLPSLRINEQLRTIGDLLNTDRHSGLTLAPEVALDDMRKQVGKPITNDDLLAGCRKAFENGFSRVKLYFMCGLPGEREADLLGIIDLATSISRLGKEVTGQWVTVVANVSNFVPKPQTPYQWNAMERREYFKRAHEFLYENNRYRTVQVKCHDIETSLLEGVMCRGNRRVGEAIELAWQRGARFDAWTEFANPKLWWQALSDAGVDVEQSLHTSYAADASLPWDHIGIRQGRAYLERERELALGQLGGEVEPKD
jgi:radical SAM family uncharacterized protein